eukprot:EG_transcript_60527
MLFAVCGICCLLLLALYMFISLCFSVQPFACLSRRAPLLSVQCAWIPDNAFPATPSVFEHPRVYPQQPARLWCRRNPGAGAPRAFPVQTAGGGLPHLRCAAPPPA